MFHVVDPVEEEDLVLGRRSAARDLAEAGRNRPATTMAALGVRRREGKQEKNWAAACVLCSTVARVWLNTR
jgi:hypothetical protein